MHHIPVLGELCKGLFVQSKCVLKKEPFYHWPVLDEKALESYTDIELAAHCMHDTPRSKQVEDTIIPSRKLARILLDILRHLRSQALLQATFADFEQDFKKVVVGDEIVPSIAVAYANMAIMLSSNMIFSISPETVKTWYEEGWHYAVHQFKGENPSDFSEFDLM